MLGYSSTTTAMIIRHKICRISCERMCSLVADDRAHPQAAQFNTVRLKVERGQQGMALRPAQ